MRNTVFKIFLITIISLWLFVYIFPWNSYDIKMPFSGKEYRLWLDLQGWIELDYKIDLDEAKKSEDFDKAKEKEIVEWLKTIVDKRVEVLNINDSEINDADYGWEKHIIVQIPLKWNDNLENTKNIEAAKDAIWKVVKIAFKEKRNSITEEDLKARKQIAENALKEVKNETAFTVIESKYKLNYENIASWKFENISELTDAKDTKENNINEVKIHGVEWYLIYTKKDNKSFNYIFIGKNPSEWKDATDSKWRVLNDKYFRKASVVYDNIWKPLVELTFNDEWGQVFYELTSRLVWQQMAIFVGWELLTAPTINQSISWGKAVITWQYTPESAKELAQNINTWVVPAPIYLISEKTIDSKIGWKALDKLIVAWGLWFLLILIFLVFVYRASWFMAFLALVIYAILVLAVVKIFWMVLTLASIAWLVLSVWMAIDANILIFERIKWELREWKNMHDALEIWFKTSWTAIWDSNITWLLVAMILFYFGINLIKWFWAMLAIWIIISLFTAMVVSRIFVRFLAMNIKNKKLFIWFDEKTDKK